MHGTSIKYSCSRDLSASGKDLPAVVNTLRGVCEVLEREARQVSGDRGFEVLVEKQIGKFSFSQIESAVYMFFVMRGLAVVQINPKNKLKVVVPGVVIEREFKKKYDANKYQAKQMLDAFLLNTKQTIQTEARFKKDVADAVL